MANSTTIIVHNNSTEFLIIVSQTVFFVLLFLMLKSGLVDRRGMMYSRQRVKEEMLQLGAIFFAIFVIVGILMIPLESYEYAHFVVPITYIVIFSIVGWELYVVFNRGDTTNAQDTLPIIKPVAESSKSDGVKKATNPTSGAAAFWSRTSGGPPATRRPFNF